MHDYTLYGGVRSRTMRVLWLLEELGVEYYHVPVAPRAEEVVALNPTGKVPVLVADGIPISDSVAIMTFLADAHGAFTAPAGTMERARQDAFVQAVNDEIDGVLWTAARHSFILPEAQRIPELKDSLRWEFNRNQDAIAERMDPDGPFALGADMSIADILLSHCMGWAASAKFEVKNERLKTHNAMMRERPAFKRALESEA